MDTMKKIRILLSSRPKLLSDVIRNLIEHQPDMIVVGEVPDPLQLLRASIQTMADVIIITPLRVNGEPKICHLLLVENPTLIIVTHAPEGESAYLYQADRERQHIEESSGQSILNAIRKACGCNLS